MNFHRCAAIASQRLRHLVLLTTVLLTSLAQATPAKPPKPPPLPPDIQRIVAHGELRVAMPAFDTPPFFRRDGDGMSGIDVDIARGLAEELGVPVRFLRQAGSFNEVIDSVARGEADLAVCKLSRTLARARLVRFSEPYLSTRHALLLNRLAFAHYAQGAELATTIRQFSGPLGVIRNSAFADRAPRSFPKARIVAFEQWGELIAALEAGRIIAAYRDELEMQRLLRQQPALALTLRLVAFTDTQDKLSVALPYDAPQLLALVNLYLAQRQPPLDAQSILRRP